MSELEVRELRYFIAVAEELNFSRAAQRLGMAQPPLSKAIAQMESRLGVRLLERTTRQVRLTNAGQVLIDQARIAVDAVHAAARRARRAGQPTPQLVVAVKPGGDAGLLREILAAYRGTGSHLPPPEVVVGGSGEPVAMLRDGRADVALLRSPFDGRGLDSQTLVVEPRLAVLPAAHRLAGRRRLRLTDLKGEPIPRWKGAAPSHTAYYTGCDGAEAGDGHTGPAPADTPEGPLVASVEQLLEVVALGQTVAFLSRSTTERHQRPDIAYRPVTGLSPSAVMVAWPETSRSAAVAAFVQAAHDVATHHPDHMTALA
ncbi:LysR family transcriptional regulator [Streptomyces sp. NBC_00572]|uniref:LysR family transcriptional regulator n=1 Tax=Streptomyces sp. NBC_00572 TaxID=2903664 RepID=UPI0022523419|nr:LysR family transcriptional regulator [Streptomyces sp. NBC_00572]MCX4984146.1 LysR substrate-binding domain-containing protein [Streptomyces sp. NBC_00572]